MFTYDLSTSVGEVRLAISDTNPAGYGFEDAEIEAFLSRGGSHDAAVVLAIKTLLADAARRTKSFAVPGLTYNDAGRVAGLQALLKTYGGDIPTVTVITPATQPYDSGYTEQAVVTTG